MRFLCECPIGGLGLKVRLGRKDVKSAIRVQVQTRLLSMGEVGDLWCLFGTLTILSLDVPIMVQKSKVYNGFWLLRWTVPSQLLPVNDDCTSKESEEAHCLLGGWKGKALIEGLILNKARPFKFGSISDHSNYLPLGINVYQSLVTGGDRENHQRNVNHMGWSDLKPTPCRNTQILSNRDCCCGLNYEWWDMCVEGGDSVDGTNSR